MDDDRRTDGGGTDADAGDADPDLEDAVAEFLRASGTVLGEYERGYMDADAALSRLEARVDDLSDAFERRG